MYYNKKKYNELFLPNVKNSVYYEEMGLVVDGDDGYAVSKKTYEEVIVDKRSAKGFWHTSDGIKELEPRCLRPFSIEFEYKGKHIFESNVLYFDLYIKVCEENNNDTNDYSEYSKAFLQNRILDDKDIRNAYLFIYKPSSEERDKFFNYDVCIYYDLEKRGELKNVKRIQQIYLYGKVIPYTRIVYKKYYGRKEENRVLIDWNDYSSSEMNMSFVEWERLYMVSKNPYCLPSNMFDSSNSLAVDSKDLSWKSDYMAKWTCPFGHQWKAKIESITQNYTYRNICPKCRCVRNLNMWTASTPNDAERDYSRIKKLIDEYGTNDYDEMKVLAKQKVSLLISAIESAGNLGDLWVDDSEFPSSVVFYYAFPNGKIGDINMYICQQIGEVRQIFDDFYEAVLSTDNREYLTLLSYDYNNIPQDIRDYLLGKMSKAEANNMIENIAFKDFLKRHYLFSKAELLALEFIKIDDSLYRQLYNCKATRSLIDKNTEGRDRVYDQVVFEGKSSGRWVAEQSLYRIVRRLFPDSQYQYRAKWLDKQTLDIFIPSIKVGIEYQGEQHFEEVSIFGGKKGLEHRQKLDRIKREKCKNQGITLLEWMYIDEITVEKVSALLSPWLSSNKT